MKTHTTDKHRLMVSHAQIGRFKVLGIHSRIYLGVASRKNADES
jgi:hypothetical protein